MTPMALALDLDLAQIRDTTRWFDKRAAEFLPPHLSSCATGGAFAAGPGIDEASEAALNRDVPKGYTTLQTYEKRASSPPTACCGSGRAPTTARRRSSG